MVRISYVINKEMIRFYPIPHFHIKKELKLWIWRSYLPCTVLPYSHTAAWPQGSRHSMYCASSLEWGLFGRNTRSAFRRTPSRNWQRKDRGLARIVFGLILLITREMHVLLRMCRLRPYVEWHGCTFEGTLSSKLRSHNAAYLLPK